MKTLITVVLLACSCAAQLEHTGPVTITRVSDLSYYCSPSRPDLSDAVVIDFEKADHTVFSARFINKFKVPAVLAQEVVLKDLIYQSSTAGDSFEYAVIDHLPEPPEPATLYAFSSRNAIVGCWDNNTNCFANENIVALYLWKDGAYRKTPEPKQPQKDCNCDSKKIKK